MQDFKFKNRRYESRHPDHISGIRKVTASPHRSRKRSKALIGLVTLSVIVAVGAAIGYFVQSRKAPQKNDAIINKNIDDAVKTLSADAGGSNFSKSLAVQSSLGFSLKYDPSTLDARGQVTDASSTNNNVTGLSYEENELGEKRAYSIVKVYLPDSEGVTFSSKSELSVVTNIRKSFWDTRVNPGESKIDALVRYSNASYKPTDGWSTAVPENTEINGIQYKKVTHTYSKKYDDLEIKNQTVVYLTVQNERPYIITITNSRPSNFDQVKILEGVVATLQYDGFDSTQLSLLNSIQSVLAASTDEALSKDVSNVPYDIDSKSVFDVILKNQPSVVRIASIRCGDLGLPSKTGQIVTTLKNACNGGIGSGSIVSKDGYIATNGHVVSVTPKSLLVGYVSTEDANQAKKNFQQILQYLLQAGYLSQTSLNSLKSQYDAGKIDDEQVVNAIFGAVPVDKIKISNDETKYSIQLGTDAMRAKEVNGRYAVGLSNTIVSAKFIGQDFNSASLDQERYEFGLGTTSDVALLKIEGKSFPTIKIGSISSLSRGAQLTAIGYPGFVDGGLKSKSNKTKPTITQGKVLYIGKESEQNSKKLIATDVPIAQGNSGGPAFDIKGLQIGLNTYGKIECEDGQCFGNGVARDVADFSELAKKNNVTIDSTSKVSDEWTKGLDSYLQGNFKGAVKSFKTVQKEYPAHYLAARMQSLAESKIGGPEDRSSEFESKTGLFIIIIGAIGIVILAGGALIIYLVRGSHKANKDLYNNPNTPPTPNTPGVPPQVQQQPPAPSNNQDVTNAQTPPSIS